ncbi:NAD(P)-binding domain-containing protein, partial [Nocardia sp. NPDC127606]|uniref:NAD(P)-binding domain-containing protein n=1 Tax=Nocardia sp. NPDC127606 TaxID=3345406 RepID=UPI00363466E7
MTKTIGFLGLGHMGGPMAANLVRAGYDVLAYDPVPAAQERARADGATVVATAVEAAVDRDVVITMLPNGKLVLDVYAELLPAAA